MFDKMTTKVMPKVLVVRHTRHGEFLGQQLRYGEKEESTAKKDDLQVVLNTNNIANIYTDEKTPFTVKMSTFSTVKANDTLVFTADGIITRKTPISSIVFSVGNYIKIVFSVGNYIKEVKIDEIKPQIGEKIKIIFSLVFSEEE